MRGVRTEFVALLSCPLNIFAIDILCYRRCVAAMGWRVSIRLSFCHGVNVIERYLDFATIKN